MNNHDSDAIHVLDLVKSKFTGLMIWQKITGHTDILFLMGLSVFSLSFVKSFDMDKLIEDHTMKESL